MSIGFSSSEDLLKALSKIGAAQGTRALLIFDGINEGNREAWRTSIPTIVASIDKTPNVALIISCRTPFDQMILPKSERDHISVTFHPGFTNNEIDATKEFFSFFGLADPNVPLLVDEFRRPLFLKIFCESLSSLSAATQKRRIKSFAAGHKGMTKFLEDFVKRVGKRIEVDFKLNGICCWWILKGRGDSQNAIGLAPLMAERGVDFVSEMDCLDIIKRVTSLSEDASYTFKQAMLAEGLLIEEAVWNNGWETVIRLPYQRFSDHLIARHLLARYLITSSESAIRRSFHKNRPLGKLFFVETDSLYLTMPNVVSAIMLEFPERIKRLDLKKTKEMFFYLPRERQNSVLVGPFITGLSWRDATSFDDGTEWIIDWVLGNADCATQRELFEELTCLATRHAHPYNASALLKRLALFDLPHRDISWSEFLRSRGADAIIYRLMDWIEREDTRLLEAELAENLIILCALICTSTVKHLRDRATKCMVFLGESHFDMLAKQTIAMRSFNDPYVGERLLAACYGSLLRQMHFWRRRPPASTCNLEKEVRRLLWGSNESPFLSHILERDFAEGIVEACCALHNKKFPRFIYPKKLSTKSHIPDAETIPASFVTAAKPAIHMDFGNYTIGRIVPERGNYNFKNEDYKNVLRQISWRIVDLGYKEKVFKEADTSIGNQNFRQGRSDDGSKVDRYGKKYSWIAFYELVGKRKLARLLKHNMHERISDIDIDPTFPPPPASWAAPISQVLRQSKQDMKEWIGSGPSPDYTHLLWRTDVAGVSGPWVLLDGFINERSAAESDGREVFTFLRGLSLEADKIIDFIQTCSATAYPGNSAIPDLLDDHYLFAGEIGSSNRYGAELRDANGLAKMQIDEAFSGSASIQVRKRFMNLKAWEQQQWFSEKRNDFANDEAMIEFLKKDPMVQIQRYKWYKGIPVEILARRFAWESYHSEENKGGNPLYPAPALVDKLDLAGQQGNTDMIDVNGQPASLYREVNVDRCTGYLLYLREDLLRSYLKMTAREFLWVNWGERTVNYASSQGIKNEPHAREIWDAHAHIHKKVVPLNSLHAPHDISVDLVPPVR